METMHLVQIAVLANIAMGVVAFCFGRHYERVKWNELISSGILPAPRHAKHGRPY